MWLDGAILLEQIMLHDQHREPEPLELLRLAIIA